MRSFPAPNGAHGPRELSRLKVLVVDDYRDAANTLADFIELGGHTVQRAFDGATALDVAADQRPDVILMELTLPHVSGLEVCRRLRATSWGHEARIIAVTGWGAAARIAESRDAGFDGHMLKPIDCRELELLLERIAGSKNTVRPLEPPPRMSAGGAFRTSASLPLLR